MDVVKLPMVPAVTGCREALSLLEASKRSALVTEIAGEPKIIHASDLVHAIAAGKRTLKQVRNKKKVVKRARPIPGGKLAPMAREWLRREAGGAPSARSNRGLVEHFRRSNLGARHRRMPVTRSVARDLEPLAGKDPVLVDVGIGEAFILVESELDGARYTQSAMRCYCEDPNEEFRHAYNRKPPSGECCDGYAVSCAR